ncbi:COG1470 family protein [Echinicola rosea]|uniref:Alpha-galactosidase NEW3 domain-containing protein n=1 Tax=Echinicola rosea TaxID=1807691 RepID=A0ABQ1V5H4_9BACT|nr:NEW3 domain-containing protein [Echinicola rosea]GGF39878.1 hypothetical protein GCM10011339_30520 [Echinicola rosea]
MSVDSFNNGKPMMGANHLFFVLLAVLFCLSVVETAAQAPESGSSLTARLINLEAPVSETFRYQATLKNGASTSAKYTLDGRAPDGWRVRFKVSGKQVTSLQVDPKKSESIAIEVTPAHGAAPGKYDVPVHAVGSDSLSLNLEAVVEGDYEIMLTTPSGRLSGEVTEGKNKQVNLQVKNTGSLPLGDVSLSSRTPPKWEATFSPSTIEQLDPGKSVDVVATVTVPEKTLPGDYVNKFTAKTAETNSEASYRMTVTTSLLSGWVGILVILVAIGLVYYLIRKFGRR